MKVNLKQDLLAEPFDILKDQLKYYSIEEVAEYSGVRSATIYMWLNGKTKTPYLRTFLAVANSIGLKFEMRKVKSNIKPNIKAV